MREGGVEPPHPFEYTDLNRARLPIPPLALRSLRSEARLHAHIYKGALAQHIGARDR